MDPNNRITKDTSSRKNTPSSSTTIHSAIESAAMLASREAYTKSIFAGYQDKIATIESEQQTLIDEAVNRAVIASNDQIQRLEETISQLKTMVHDGKAQVANVQNEMAGKTTAFERTIRRLNKQLEVGPNSWFEIHVSGKSRKTRTYVKRPGAPFNDTLADLAKDWSKTVDYMRFKVGAGEVLGKDRRILLQLGVKDGETIEFLA
ncbi:hypothetical protein M409DRAFT_30168 [Zasmidium cellare ATCC 36951]|uniref:Ubiquitin-like domain-containing protein n=1 Tax=Zasmidium cellare ATCC 36951 TaxID=1080233 RepID=A0A6A6BZI7_ZASCE|nr:uncharacterized protein M409DRAFT_30168 [Zasmidium cellare ATCC 36951]KAF2159418.1 hypothetical protein M409DRAFT_30168 [Zasmidium cellare ATCC 36951]